MTAKVLQLVRRMPPPPSREEQIMAIVRERLDATINIIDCNATAGEIESYLIDTIAILRKAVAK